MYQIKRFSNNKQRQRAAGRLSSALMEAIDEAQYAVNPEKSFDFLACLRFLLSKTGAVLLCGFVCMVLALAFYQISPPKYQATSKLYILENDGSGIHIADLQTGSLLLSDYREVLKTWEVYEDVRMQLKLDLSYRDMQEMLKVQTPSGSRLLYITISHEDPVMAAELANAYAQAARRFIAEELQGLQPDLFSSAMIPSRVSGLSMPLRLLAAFAAGMLLMTGFYVLFFCLDDHVRTAEDLALAADAPVLAAVPRRSGKEMQIGEKEQVCLLASRLLTLDAQCLLISAPCSGEGVSFVCEDLVRALKHMHRRALWIQVEHRPFWMDGSEKSLADYLDARCGWQELIQTYDSGDKMVIRGTENELPAQLFHPRMALMMQEAKTAYDLILVDVPPVNQRADGAAFYPFCDGCVLVTSCGKNAFHEIEAYDTLLAESHQPLLGCVLNSVRCKTGKARMRTQTMKESEAV